MYEFNYCITTTLMWSTVAV